MMFADRAAPVLVDADAVIVAVPVTVEVLETLSQLVSEELAFQVAKEDEGVTVIDPTLVPPAAATLLLNEDGERLRGKVTPFWETPSTAEPADVLTVIVPERTAGP